ncbi:Fructose-bisphosphate aldolase-lysine N-methyltransferase [Spatholobus suberectus]|nr:Fructose-bisphosphate aldolase-lysine N-methyltransferase [Spatholobus suberectus]
MYQTISLSLPLQAAASQQAFHSIVAGATRVRVRLSYALSKRRRIHAGSCAMPFRARTATASLWWSLQTVFNTHHTHSLHPSSIHLNFHSLALSKPQFSGNCDEFLPWLERKAGSTISSSLFIGKSSYGRSLFASKIIQTGDCILKVPYRVQITADNLLPEIRSLIGEEVGNIAKLAIVVLIEKKLGQGSEWYPYISCLPQQGELHNMVFWNESELEMIRPSSVYQETIDQKSQIEKDFLAIKPVFECFHQRFGDFTYEDFMHACTLVGSRAWGSTKGLALIPFADFLNHDGVSKAIVMSDDDKQCSEIIADRDYALGEQVLIRYGKFSNATLMLDFGFTIPYNIYDQVQIQFDIPEHDPLHDMKLELLHRYFVPPPEDMKGLTYPVKSFSIKEVRSDRGKGKGLPQSLRALARVLSCTTSQELDDLVVEAAQTDGRLARRPLQDISKEIQAHMMLLSLFIQLIEEHNATIMSLDSSYSPSLRERLSVRRLMARDLLHGELRILKSASAWLENYCFSLT